MAVKMTEEEYREHVEESNGLCSSCGAIRFGDTEPDAEGYPCEECGCDTVVGIENALMDGSIVFVPRRGDFDDDTDLVENDAEGRL